MELDNLTTQLCVTEEEKITAYNIRYQAYTTVGYNPVCTTGLFTDPFDAAPNNFTFLLKERGKPVATVRASVLHRPRGWVQVPCKGGFEPEFSRLEQEYDTIVEMGRLAVLPDVRGLASLAPLALFCCIYMLDERFGRTAIVCGSSKKHKRFYQRLGMKSLCDFGPRPNTAIDLTLMAKSLDLEAFIQSADAHLDEATIRRLIPAFPDCDEVPAAG
ncbi:N-acyl amino acid synthase FeeM domain-containing protein [Photobacterium atrarenae]|uniref:GNAT family N-acetyltransferase n=1 Tax=Photobacterium atrarenae TaxID=865757 RepID=A0ABY5GM05_9GAMM|nr:GNAT family N-acyltransferase [Photobacterium atrarenae]UTV30201.1 GNAT family N-acetyltransferase [Photobacterium atrarenae]